MQHNRSDGETEKQFLERRANMRSVGRMRQVSALCGSEEEIVIVGPAGHTHPDLPKMRVVRCYAATTGPDGSWGGTFKIEVELI